MRKKTIALIIGIFVILFLFFTFFVNIISPVTIKNNEKKITEMNNLLDVEEIPATIYESGWSTPIKLAFNDNGWEDSPYITRDGSQILFFYHPSPNLADPKITTQVTEYILSNQKEAIENGFDGKIYVSDRPFKNRRIHPISQNKEFPYSDACPYISLSGDIYTCSTKESFIQNKDIPATVYRNGKRLDFGTGKNEGNPHLCEAKDEMWFDCPGDENICVIHDFIKNNFKGKVERAPYPINAKNADKIVDAQPFLTDDCKTLYFTSNRKGREILAIYKTTRLDEAGKNWSDPELFISHPAGIGEISMTADGKEMIFPQLFWRDDGSPGIDIWYSKKG